MITIASYFAIAENADFIGTATLRTMASEAKEAYQAVRSADIGGTVSGYHDTQDERKLFADPSQRHRDLKEVMVQLTNERRASAGIPPVRLGSNPAAQIHAEVSIAGCYSSHWDQWGLKPNHRYTLTGGTGADAENGSGSDYCIKPSENYVPLSDMQKEVADTINGWMESPGHRRTLLNPAHTVLNPGIAHDRFNQVMVQHFSSDYVNYATKPYIDPEGVLHFSGTVSHATLDIGNSVNITIAYDPPPKPLTRGQLAHTYSLCNPITVAYVVEPLPPGWSHSTPTVRSDTHVAKCVNPHQMPPDLPAPNNPQEARRAWASAKAASAITSTMPTQEIKITGDRVHITTDDFHVRADISAVLREHGPGVYTVSLWGRPEHMKKPTPLSVQSIFWTTEPPDGSPYATHPYSVEPPRPSTNP